MGPIFDHQPSRCSLRVLHTADWHLGRSLYGRSRLAESATFLNWLLATIDTHHVDVLLMAGDVFDSTTPSYQAQQLYYQFLANIAKTNCQHVVIIAGNHDSPSLINAPKTLLKSMNIHVIGHPSSSPADEVITLFDVAGNPLMRVCAVPFLREGDVRVSQAGETQEDKNRQFVEGVMAHYARCIDYAQQCQTHDGPAPLVVMGHLFTAGGVTIDGDGVRELQVGSLSHIPAAVFPVSCSYVALGHLHVPQIVGGNETVRYSGSPFAMGFGEATQQKTLPLVTLSDQPAVVELIPIPCWQPLVTIRGDLAHITSELHRLMASKLPYWVDIDYIGAEVVSQLRTHIEEQVQGSSLSVLRLSDFSKPVVGWQSTTTGESLGDLTDLDVFHRCLDRHRIPDDQRPELVQTYLEAVDLLGREVDGVDGMAVNG